MVVTTVSGEYTPEDKTILNAINDCGERVLNGKELIENYLALLLNAANTGAIHTIKLNDITYELNVEVLETK